MALTKLGLSLINGLGTAATLNVGTGANQILQLDGTGKLPIVDGSQLTNLPTSGGSGSVNRFTGDGATLVFTLTSAPGSLNAVNVYINGVYQNKNNFTVVGTTLTLTTAPASGSIVECVYGQAVAINVPADGSVTAAKIPDGSITITKLTPTVNTANGLVQLTNAGKMPVLDGSALTGVVATGGGAMTFVGSYSVGTGASIELNIQFQPGYDYIFNLNGICCTASAQTWLCLRFGTGSPPTYQTTGYQYVGGIDSSDNVAGVGSMSPVAGGGDDTKIQIGQLSGTGTNTRLNGEIKVFSADNTKMPGVTWGIQGNTYSGSVINMSFGSGARIPGSIGAGAITAISLFPRAGVFSGGTVSCFSIKKS